MSAYDPSATWAAQDFRSAKALFVPSLKPDIVLLLHAHDLQREGPHGNPHPTARIHIHTWRRSSCVAARGTLAASSDAGDRVPQWCETGHFESRNVVIEYRWAEGHYGSITNTGRRSGPSASKGDRGGRRHPAGACGEGGDDDDSAIVFSIGADPVEAGLVASLNRPGGSLTGVVTLAVALGPKRLQLAHELVPAASSAALLINPSDAAQTDVKRAQEAARDLGLQLHILHASSERELDVAFATVLQLRAGMVVINADAFFNSRSKQLAELALRHAVPTVYQYREFAAAGGLASYGSRLADAYRQVGIYTGRILKGEKPADLPVQQSTRAELIINLKTAKALALEVPSTLLARADEVIE
jgi:putative ABC transport system substrate-binding protein